MSLAFRNVTSAPLENFDVVAPDGTVIGIIGENGSGKSQLLRLAAGLETPTRAPSRLPARSAGWARTMR